jgi:hypothetical protein
MLATCSVRLIFLLDNDEWPAPASHEQPSKFKHYHCSVSQAHKFGSP